MSGLWVTQSPALAGGGVSFFSLALRLLARIVALASSMRLQSGWDQAILPGTLIRRSPSPRRIIDGGARGSEGATSIVDVYRKIQGPTPRTPLLRVLRLEYNTHVAALPL